MADKVNWNPFTNTSLTAQQIAELDANEDGIVSDSEMLSKWSWLSENSADTESGYQAASFQGVKGTVDNQQAFQQQCQLLLEEYMEDFFDQHLAISDEDRAKYTSVFNKKYAEFVNEQLKLNPAGPWDMAVISEEFAKVMDAELKAQETALNEVNMQVNNYTNNKDTAKSNMLLESFTANENNYITEAEWAKVRNNTVQYLMGMLLSGEIEDDFLIHLNSKYATNANYKAALDAINQLKSCDDPVKMQQLLTTAQTKIANFVDALDKNKAVEAINNFALAEAEKIVVQILNKQIDSYLEVACTPEMSDEEKTALRTYLEQLRDKYVLKISEDGTINEVTEKDLIQGFSDFMTAQAQMLVDAQVALYNKTTEIDKAYETVVSTSDKVNANGNVSEDERTELINVAKELILNQLLAGNSEIAMLTALGESGAVKQMTTLVTKIWAETDPDKLEELRKELEDLIKTTLEKHDGEDLVSAVNSMKPVEITQRTNDKAVYNSSIGSDYASEKSRTTSYGYRNEERLQEIQEKAKADLAAYAESLKVQLKSELGANYDETEVERYINSAINDTISLFTQNSYKKNQHGDYTTGSDNQAFLFAGRSGTRKGKYVYNVKALIDTFVAKFNETSKIKNAASIDPSKATYDREDVIAASIGNKYDRNQTVRVKGHKNDESVYAEVIEQAKEDLKSVAAAVKQSLLAEGVPIDMAKVDAWLDELIMETIEDMKAAFQYCQPGGGVSGGGIGASITSAAGTAVGTVVTKAAATAAWTAYNTAAAAALNPFSTATIDTGVLMSLKSSAVSASATASVVPIVGWCITGAVVAYTLLSSFTNLFGATYGQHNQDAGFFFERKSNSKSGRWGYDPQTLVNLFLAKVDAKVAEEKEAYKNKNNPNK